MLVLTRRKGEKIILDGLEVITELLSMMRKPNRGVMCQKDPCEYCQEKLKNIEAIEKAEELLTGHILQRFKCRFMVWSGTCSKKRR